MEVEESHFKNLAELGVSGILCVSGLSSLAENLIDEKFPLIFLDRRPDNAEKLAWATNGDVDVNLRTT